ncbi:MAG: hypothetical protein JRJ14_06500, partial [Deltaproteobacteria bacterium]|nr:hypothetical protein [Deltaproteobacteria bacterium]
KTKRVAVKRGYENRYYLQIVEGLNDGDKIIISSIPKLRPEMKVEGKDVTAEKGVLTAMKKEQIIREQE